jgi:hypothetical protein
MLASVIIEGTLRKIQQLVRKQKLTVSYATFATCPKLSIITTVYGTKISE